LAPEDKAKYTGCGAGRVLCRITVDGMVAPCATLPMAAGSLREQLLEDIWLDPVVMKRIRDRGNITGNCVGCDLLNSCGGCRAMALASDALGNPVSGT